MSIGKLRIGDEWNAIRLIATTQTNPWKALAELVENSIDAKANKVTVLREEKEREFWLTILDDGVGVPSRNEARNDGDSQPDVEYIPTRTCDSIKKRYDDARRRGIQGQFGIGILGFWSLGETLELITRRSGTNTYHLYMKRDDENYETGICEYERSGPGTTVRIGPLLPTVQYQLTGEKIAHYLGRELRGRIRESSVSIEVRDTVSKGRRSKIEGLATIYRVKPWEFSGEPVQELKQLSTPFGEVKLELYVAFPPEGERVFVSIQRKGTVIQRDIQELEEFQKDPWNLNRLDGAIEFAALNVAPATRYGVTKDENYEAFVKALKAIESKLRQIIRDKEKRAEVEGLAELLKRLQKNFAKAFKDLRDYRWFDGKLRGPLPPPPPPPPPPDMVGAGPLARLDITPRLTTVAIHTEKKFRAIAYDDEGKILTEDVEFDWSVGGEGFGVLERRVGGEAIFKAGSKEGVMAVNVRAKKADRTAEASATVVIVREKLPSRPPTGKFPPMEPVRDSLGDWRSRFVSSIGVIEMNEAHRDYLRVRARRQARERYIGRLYAKELVLANFVGEASDRILERLIEVVERVE